MPAFGQFGAGQEFWNLISFMCVASPSPAMNVNDMPGGNVGVGSYIIVMVLCRVVPYRSIGI